MLNISGLAGITDDGVSYIAQNCHSLEFLNIANCPNVSRECAEAVAAHFSNAEVIIE